MSEPSDHKRNSLPRWLIWAFAGKLVLIVLIVGAVLWAAKN